MCLYPKLIPNRKYTANNKNGGIIPPIRDPRVLAVSAGCGNCIECRKQKAREWKTRLQEDIKKNTTAKFITLTFSTESIKHINSKIPHSYKDNKGNDIPITGYKRDNEIAIYAIRHFLERYRKKHGKSLRHWLVTELGHGKTEHIHLHGIIWLPTINHWEKQLEEITQIWQYGFTWTGYYRNGRIENYVNNRTINYCVKYVSKMDHHHRYYKSKVLCSAGIGSNYIPDLHYEHCEERIDLRISKTGKRTWVKSVRIIKTKYAQANGDWQTNKYNAEKTDETYQNREGIKTALPIYWRNKIYSEDERELLWLQKLDKEERWVCGTKVSTKEGLHKYFKLVDYHRERNAALGYGDDKKNWKREEYENNRRKWQLDKRTGVGQATTAPMEG